MTIKNKRMKNGRENAPDYLSGAGQRLLRLILDKLPKGERQVTYTWFKNRGVGKRTIEKGIHELVKVAILTESGKRHVHKKGRKQTVYDVDHDAAVKNWWAVIEYRRIRRTRSAVVNALKGDVVEAVAKHRLRAKFLDPETGTWAAESTDPLAGWMPFMLGMRNPLPPSPLLTVRGRVPAEDANEANRRFFGALEELHRAALEMVFCGAEIPLLIGPFFDPTTGTRTSARLIERRELYERTKGKEGLMPSFYDAMAKALSVGAPENEVEAVSMLSEGVDVGTIVKRTGVSAGRLEELSRIWHPIIAVLDRFKEFEGKRVRIVRGADGELHLEHVRGSDVSADDASGNGA